MWQDANTHAHVRAVLYRGACLHDIALVVDDEHLSHSIVEEAKAQVKESKASAGLCLRRTRCSPVLSARSGPETMGTSSCDSTVTRRPVLLSSARHGQCRTPKSRRQYRQCSRCNRRILVCHQRGLCPRRSARGELAYASAGRPALFIHSLPSYRASVCWLGRRLDWRVRWRRRLNQ